MLSLLPSAHKECRHLLGLVREHWQVMVAYCLYSLWTSYMLLGPIYESHREAVAAPLAIVIPYALVGAVCLALSLLFKWRRFAFDSTSHKVLTAALMTVGSVCLVVLANDRTMGTPGDGRGGVPARLLGRAALHGGGHRAVSHRDRPLVWVARRDEDAVRGGGRHAGPPARLNASPLRSCACRGRDLHTAACGVDGAAAGWCVHVPS